MKNLIKTKALFANTLHGLGMEQDLNERLAPFRFDLNEVVAYNESTYEGWSTIWINGTTITITMSMDEIDASLGLLK